MKLKKGLAQTLVWSVIQEKALSLEMEGLISAWVVGGNGRDNVLFPVLGGGYIAVTL